MAASSPLDVLRQYWGYAAFRSCQEQVVEAVLGGADNLVVMVSKQDT